MITPTFSVLRTTALVALALVLFGCAKHNPPSQPSDAAVRLADETAGKACKRDADCDKGRCANALHLTSATQSTDAPGGYCTLDCVTHVECGEGGECAVPAGEDTGECVGRCQDDSECRKGYVCAGAGGWSGIRVMGTCLPAPSTDQLEGGVAGQPCSTNADCAGGECLRNSPLGAEFPGNYCSGRCYRDAECGEGGACLVFANSPEAGHCYARCGEDADCTRDGYRCRTIGPDFDACVPALPALPDLMAGKACSDDADCGGQSGSCATQLRLDGFGTNDFETAPGGYCTQSCALDSDCGAGGQCISAGLTGGMCMGNCATDDDCRQGYVCIPHGRDRNSTDRVCVPPG